MFSKFKKKSKKVKKSQSQKSKSKKSQIEKSKKVKKSQQKSTVNKKSKKQVKQKLCIGKQVKEKLVTRQIAAFLLMAYGFQSIKDSLEPFWLFNFHLFQPQASPNPLPQSRRIPTQPQPLSQGLFSPKPAAAQILGQVAARARRWAGCGWLLAEGSG